MMRLQQQSGDEHRPAAHGRAAEATIGQSRTVGSWRRWRASSHIPSGMSSRPSTKNAGRSRRRPAQIGVLEDAGERRRRARWRRRSPSSGTRRRSRPVTEQRVRSHAVLEALQAPRARPDRRPACSSTWLASAVSSSNVSSSSPPDRRSSCGCLQPSLAIPRQGDSLCCPSPMAGTRISAPRRPAGPSDQIGGLSRLEPRQRQTPRSARRRADTNRREGSFMSSPSPVPQCGEQRMRRIGSIDVAEHERAGLDDAVDDAGVEGEVVDRNGSYDS